MEEKNIQNLSENDQTGSDRSMQQHDAKAKYMQTDFNAQIGEADTWLDKAKRWCARISWRLFPHC